ncbi:phage tail terminator family protein [Desnuesiella massiliensis]|uniref:phage tail terminator family protein n=1 Tax=Desnuesiella massiliensis TaxID=1650662 RepID=UPI0006E28B5D|nr:hypothetical protein [Desnuesiella massiliensis]
MISANDFKKQIKEVLAIEFPNTSVYDEGTEQGFNKPCFFVKVLNSSQSKELSSKYTRSLTFDISYFSNKESINSDFNDTGDKLYEVLEYLPIDNSLYRTTAMNYKVVEDVLHFTLQYSYHFIKKAETSELMNKLTQKAGVKNGS